MASCGFGSEIERLAGSRHTIEDVSQAVSDHTRQFASDLDGFYRQLGLPRVLNAEALKPLEALMRALDGEQIHDLSESLEYCKMCGVSEADFHFVRWMGLLQEAAGGVWHLPKLYQQLLE